MSVEETEEQEMDVLEGEEVEEPEAGEDTTFEEEGTEEGLIDEDEEFEFEMEDEDYEEGMEMEDEEYEIEIDEPEVVQLPSLEILDDKHITFTDSGVGELETAQLDQDSMTQPARPSQTIPSADLRKSRSRKSSHHVVLEDVRSDKSDAPRKLKGAELCIPKLDDFNTAHTTEEFVRQRDQENDDFEASALSAMESLAPFKLTWVYGRLPEVNAINLTGLYKNHVAYASSNIVIIFDYVGNEQRCLQGHKNAITCLSMDKKCRFLASTDAGIRSLIIVWDTVTGKALKFFPEPHDGKGCVFVTFTSVDFILATIGNEEASKQTVCLWDFNPHHRLKKPIAIGQLPPTPDISRQLSFDETRPEFFTATGDRSVVFCTWIRAPEPSATPETDTSTSSDDKKNGSGDSIFCFKPRTKKGTFARYKKFTFSHWMKEGKWLVTGTMSGYLLVWTPPVVLGLEDPPDPKKNIRELRRYYRLSDAGITYLTLYKDYVVVGDEKGIIRFFDYDMKILRWTKNFFVKPIQTIHFNLTDELPQFKRQLRQKFDGLSKDYLQKEGNSRVRDYSMGGFKDRELSMTTITRPPLHCTDFIFTVGGGDIYYYHFKQNKVDLLVNGSPGRYVACDVCPGSNNVIFSTRRGEIHVYDFVTHKLVFTDQIFTGSHRVSTMKFHPTGFFVCFGLVDGILTFRRNFSWRTLIPPVTLASAPILRITFSQDGILLSYFTTTRIVILLKYVPKAKNWVSLGKCRTHQLDICDVQFFYDPRTKKNRLFSLGLDRYLVEYDLGNCNVGDPRGLRVLKIIRLEETCQPTAMAFVGPPEFGADCITFSNTLNKLRIFQYQEERVRQTVSGPVFGREHAINRMIDFPAQMSSTRFKKFVIFIRGNKLGIMDTPVDGNPHRYIAVFTHPGAIIDIAVLPEKGQIFTLGHQDNAALQWEACVKSVEATVIMGGSGITPFYHSIRRHWGGACQDIVKDIDLIFFFLNLKRVDTQTEIFNITRTIRISEIPAVCRACGFYPSEYEVDLMLDEARRIKMLDQHYTDDNSTEFSFEDFIKLFSNHYYRISDTEIDDAFRFLGFEERVEPYICRSDFVYFLINEGERLAAADFPVYFEPMYLEQTQTVFSHVLCHVKAAQGSSSSESDTTAETKRKMSQVTEEESSESSSSSSTRTGDEESSSDLAESNESKEDKDGEGEEDEDEDDDDDDDDDDEMKEAKEQKKKKKAEGEGEKKPEGEEGAGAKEGKEKDEHSEKDEKDDHDHDHEHRHDDDASTSASEKSKEQTRKSSDITVTSEKTSGSKEDEETSFGEGLETDEELMDLPERIDLSFFVQKMLPPDSQQTIRWRPEIRQRKPKEFSPEVARKKRNQEYYETLMKEAIDPNFPIHKKLLNTLYAEYYMEHRDFDVPEELQYPGYGPDQQTWFEDEEEEEESLEEIPGEEEDEETEKSASSKEVEIGLSPTDEAEYPGEGDEDDEEEHRRQRKTHRLHHLEMPGEFGYDYYDPEEIAAGIFQTYRSDEYEYPGEGMDEMYGEDGYDYPEEDGDNTSMLSPPFSMSDLRQSMDDSVGHTGSRSGIVPGYNSDNSEYTDVENAYEEEDVAFIKEVNENFKAQADDTTTAADSISEK